MRESKITFLTEFKSFWNCFKPIFFVKLRQKRWVFVLNRLFNFCKINSNNQIKKLLNYLNWTSISIQHFLCYIKSNNWTIQIIKFLNFKVPNFFKFQIGIETMKTTYCLFQIKFITEYTNVQHVIITQILLKLFN
jgi:hypothetical protein